MSVPSNSASNQGSGLSPASPEAVLNELKRMAERKASLKMFYAAADLFHDYKGPFATETAAERARLAADYDQRGRAAEKSRLERGPIPPTPKSVPQTAPPAPSSELPTDKPPEVIPRQAPSLAVAAKSGPPKPAPARTQMAQHDGLQLTMVCRWCKQPVSLDATRTGKLVPCPKCGVLIRAPKS